MADLILSSEEVIQRLADVLEKEYNYSVKWEKITLECVSFYTNGIRAVVHSVESNYKD